MGKIYKFYPAKPVFLACVTLFEVGSAICGAAPNSKAFIIGRAVAGLGASGLFSGLMVVMFHTIPLQQRPMFQGAFGAIFAIGSVVGPLVGGTFVDKVTWYVYLPMSWQLARLLCFVNH
jgi:MFS family permease